MNFLGEFEGCCGINILHNFNGNIRDEERALKINEEEHDRERAGLLLIALTASQKKTYGPMLKRNGYTQLIKSFKNPRHGSKLTLYKKLTPNPKTPEDEDDDDGFLW